MPCRGIGLEVTHHGSGKSRWSHARVDSPANTFEFCISKNYLKGPAPSSWRSTAFYGSFSATPNWVAASSPFPPPPPPSVPTSLGDVSDASNLPSKRSLGFRWAWTRYSNPSSCWAQPPSAAPPPSPALRSASRATASTLPSGQPPDQMAPVQNKKAAPVQNRRSARTGERASTSGHGVHFISPKKSRDRAKQAVVVNTSAAARSNTLRSRITSLLNKDPWSAPPATGPIPDQPQDPQISSDTKMEDWEDVVMEPPPSLPPPVPIPIHSACCRPPHCLQTIPGARATDPFREGLGNAVMRFSHLRDRARANLEAALVTAADSLFPPTPNTATEAEEAEEVPDPQTRRDASPQETKEATNAEARLLAMGSAGSAAEPTEGGAGSAGSAAEPTEAGAEPRLTSGQAARILRERCPACFGLQEWGRPLRESRRVLQLQAPQNCQRQANFIQPRVLHLQREAAARKKTPAKFTPTIPQDALDACEESWDAANESKKKVDPKQYDASGIFAMTCRHAQVLFFVDIDTPGERQEYIVACLDEIARLLPLTATILQAYNIACVTDHSFNLFPILIDGLRERIGFIINAMHAYGHQWICQLVYSPHLRRGVGLTDQEGVERVWSRIRRLIPLTRHQWNSQRIWTIDQYIAFINDEGRDGLGGWIARQQKNLEKKEDTCLKVLADCRVPETELRRQWKEQKAAQTSARSHAPARLRRDLDKVLALQTQIESVEKAIAEVKTSITTAGASANSLLLLGSLEATREMLSEQADTLYASLNIHETFPQLRDLPLDFVRTLLLTRDLKINIRKRAVGSFLEWESLDRAVSGRREPLGTKMHQTTRKAITRRQPALLRSIRKFNSYCCELERLRPSTCHIPIPSPLPTQLNGLRTDPTLHEDVWIEPCVGRIPRWLDDENVRDGIRALHVFDRCREEGARLNAERCNLPSRAILASASAILASPGSTIRPNVTTGALALAPLSSASRTILPVTALPLAPISSASHAIIASASAILAPPTGPTAVNITSTICPNATTGALALAPVSSVLRTSLAPAPATPFDSTAATTRAPVALGSDIIRTVTVELDLMVEDLFEGGDTNAADDMVSEDLNPGAISDPDEVGVLGEMLGMVEVDDENEVDNENDTSGIESASVQFEICWDPPGNPSVDPSPLRDLNTCNKFFEPIDPLPRFGCIVVGTDGRKNMSIAVEDIAHFQSPTGRLCGFGLNGVAAALLELFTRTGESARRCTLFSTYDLPRVHFRCSDSELWRVISPSKYWEKNLWLIPIHRRDEQHRVFVLVDVYAERIYFFDSLGGDNWRPDLRLVMLLITRLVILASRHRHPLHVSTPQETPWIVRPLVSVRAHL
ncbi:hypothetical protein DFH08DRAFT_817537 [Mycena albidolilacea]|uniref:Ubiquitin-like protease family profile domain-containing protein n=1 Tax=Mycena albidolilacea TaxID=1033008 RepID=A0AAD7EI44_9AGAR|nr:hypothetical protein DFH08DRAFT_817537 [Mycena albidolilacea]